jgi:hypothetical protein
VATVVIQQADVGLAPGGTAPLTARALDAAGSPVSAAIAWSSSDGSIATVDASGVVTALALGSAQITAAAGGVTSAPVSVWVNSPGSTDHLLAAAVAAGELSADEALVYRVWAAFGDPRLPGKYRGNVDNSDHGDDLLMAEAADRFDALTPEQQDDIGDYFVPPAYERGPAATPPGTAAAASESRPGFCSGWTLNSDWVSQDTDHIRVWHTLKGTTWSPASITAVVDAAKASYDTLVSAGGFRAPLDDSQGLGLCYGGDGKLDIYLLEESLGGNLALTEPMGSRGSDPLAAYILVSSVLATAPLEKLTGQIAHEFMHAVQLAYPGLGLHSYLWSLDATANWAMQIVLPTNLAYQRYAKDFSPYTNQPLFFPNHYCGTRFAGPECAADPNADAKMYASYLFFQFLTMTGSPSAVRLFFENAQNAEDSLATLNYVLTGAGGLSALWPKFTLALWNQDPVLEGSSFRGWDKLPDTLEPAGTSPQVVDFDDTGPNTKTLTGPTVLGPDGTEVGLRELSASFDHYTFGPGVHALAFYNGFSQNLTTVAPFPVGVPPAQPRDAGTVFVSYDRPPPDPVKGRALWALTRINGMWKMDDWTNQHIITFCRDKADERIDDLVLLYSNGNFTSVRDAAYDANALGPVGDKKATLIASPMPCWKYQGTATAHLAYDDGIDSFDITNKLAATFVGAPYFQPVTLATGTGTVLTGWRFTADAPTINLTFQVSIGKLGSCGLNVGWNDSAVRDATWYPTLPTFDSLLPIPGSAGDLAYLGSGRGWQWYITSACMGVVKYLPAPPTFDFDLDETAFQTVDLAGRRLIAAPPGKEGPVVDNGSYPNPGMASNSWCFSALTEGGPAPTGCP